MRKNTPICSQCIERIQGYGIICAEIMQLVCDDAIDGTPNYYSDLYSPTHIRKVVEFLERKGFLLTTDIEANLVAILPNCSTAEYNEENEEFCWCHERIEL